MGTFRLWTVLAVFVVSISSTEGVASSPLQLLRNALNGFSRVVSAPFSPFSDQTSGEPDKEQVAEGDVTVKPPHSESLRHGRKGPRVSPSQENVANDNETTGSFISEGTTDAMEGVDQGDMESFDGEVPNADEILETPAESPADINDVPDTVNAEELFQDFEGTADYLNANETPSRIDGEAQVPLSAETSDGSVANATEGTNDLLGGSSVLEGAEPTTEIYKDPDQINNSDSSEMLEGASAASAEEWNTDMYEHPTDHDKADSTAYEDSNIYHASDPQSEMDSAPVTTLIPEKPETEAIYEAHTMTTPEVQTDSSGNSPPLHSEEPTPDVNDMEAVPVPEESEAHIGGEALVTPAAGTTTTEAVSEHVVHAEEDSEPHNTELPSNPSGELGQFVAETAKELEEPAVPLTEEFSAESTVHPAGEMNIEMPEDSVETPTATHADGGSEESTTKFVADGAEAAGGDATEVPPEHPTAEFTPEPTAQPDLENLEMKEELVKRPMAEPETNMEETSTSDFTSEANAAIEEHEELAGLEAVTPTTEISAEPTPPVDEEKDFEITGESVDMLGGSPATDMSEKPTTVFVPEMNETMEEESIEVPTEAPATGNNQEPVAQPDAGINSELAEEAVGPRTSEARAENVQLTTEIVPEVSETVQGAAAVPDETHTTDVNSEPTAHLDSDMNLDASLDPVESNTAESASGTDEKPTTDVNTKVEANSAGSHVTTQADGLNEESTVDPGAKIDLDMEGDSERLAAKPVIEGNEEVTGYPGEVLGDSLALPTTEAASITLSSEESASQLGAGSVAVPEGSEEKLEDEHDTEASNVQDDSMENVTKPTPDMTEDSKAKGGDETGTDSEGEYNEIPTAKTSTEMTEGSILSPETDSVSDIQVESHASVILNALPHDSPDTLKDVQETSRTTTENFSTDSSNDPRQTITAETVIQGAEGNAHEFSESMIDSEKDATETVFEAVEINENHEDIMTDGHTDVQTKSNANEDASE